jgi:hypothetical protein
VTWVTETTEAIREPFLFRYKERNATMRAKPLCATPERGGESNPKEEESQPEPTQKGPYGD